MASVLHGKKHWQISRVSLALDILHARADTRWRAYTNV